MKMKAPNTLSLLALLGLLFLTPLLASCTATGLSIGAGSGGVGVGMHSGHYPGYGYGYGYPGFGGWGWPGFGFGGWGHRHGGGVMMSIPVTSGPGVPVGYADYPVGERYPARRVVPLPGRNPITEASHADWKRYDDLHHSALPYYRGRSFLSGR